MPEPKKNEDKKDYMARCIGVLIEEGKKPDQAVAICSSMFEQHQKDNKK